MSRIFFAWVDDDATVFGPEHEVEDEEIVEGSVSHDEGDVAHLELTVRNPRVGLIASGRQVWCILSLALSSGAATPIFRGRLVGVPTDIIAEAAKLEFVAKPRNYFSRKVALAETLKVRPYWDPVFIDEPKRAEPDSVLEGYSARWHVDRVTHDVTISDFLVGEDGDVEFHQGEVPYASVRMTLEQTPLRAVRVLGSVHWTQRTPITSMSINRGIVLSYTGGSLIGDWPRPGASLGGGWTVASGSRAADVYGLENTQSYSHSLSWQSKQEEHATGDTISISLSRSGPLTGAPLSQTTLTEYHQIGEINPFNDPPVNRPSKEQFSYMYAPLWAVAYALNLNYQASRSRTEEAAVLMRADVQPILTDASSDAGQTPEDVELVHVPGSDVGLPLINVLSWYAARGQTVGVGTVIQVPAGSSPLLFSQTFQIAISAGIAGTTEPAFSEIAGVQTADGPVTWVCLGASLPTAAQDWTENTDYSAGQIILPVQRSFLVWSDLTPPNAPFTGQAGAASEQQIIKTGSVYQSCTQAGQTGLYQPAFGSTRGAVTTDGGAQWTCVGSAVPDGTNYQLCVTSGRSGLFVPGFADAAGASHSDDGAVTWVALGRTEGSIAMPIEDPARRSYFPTDRGRWSLEHLVAVGRSHLLLRSRAVRIEFECSVERAVELSCRKNATLHDYRLPGGTATGKIISYKIDFSGGTGKIMGSVTVACAVGRGQAVEGSDGVPEYCDDDCCDRDCQFHAGELIVLAPGDVTYQVPADAPTDDGLVFPLSLGSAIKKSAWHGSIGDQLVGVEIGFQAAVSAQRRSEQQQDFGNDPGVEDLFLAQHTVAKELAHRAIWLELELNPVAGQTYGQEFVISASDLTIPRQIDLEYELSGGGGLSP